MCSLTGSRQVGRIAHLLLMRQLKTQLEWLAQGHTAGKQSQD